MIYLLSSILFIGIIFNIHPQSAFPVAGILLAIFVRNELKKPKTIKGVIEMEGEDKKENKSFHEIKTRWELLEILEKEIEIKRKAFVHVKAKDKIYFKNLLNGEISVHNINDEIEIDEKLGVRQRILMEILDPLSRIAIFGGMGSGKSELLKRLAHSRSKKGTCIVVDSHAAPDTWPVGCEVVGRGRNYDQIETFVIELHEKMGERYQELSVGITREEEFDIISVIIDEFTILNQFCDVSEQIKSLMCECRKVGIQIIIAGQSDRVKALGLEGAGDLKQGFEAIVYLAKDQTGYYADVFQGMDKHPRRYSHPGPFEMVSRNGSRDIQVPEKKENLFQLGKPEKKVLSYIERHGSVQRKKLTVSRCLGYNSKASDYDHVLSKLIDSGKIAVRTIGNKAEWEYLIN